MPAEAVKSLVAGLLPVMEESWAPVLLLARGTRAAAGRRPSSPGCLLGLTSFVPLSGLYRSYRAYEPPKIQSVSMLPNKIHHPVSPAAKRRPRLSSGGLSLTASSLV